MPRMKFNTRVKYNNAYHNALEPFDVNDADVPELQGEGGVLIVENMDKDAPKEHPKAPDDSQKRGKEKVRRG